MEPQAPVSDALIVPVEPVIIPVEVETPAEDVSEPVEETLVPVSDVPVVDAPSPEAAPSVPGTPATPAAQAEVSAIQQEQAPLPVPATAAPYLDAVTTNLHLESIQVQLQEVVDYCRNFLSNHPVADTVVADVEVLLNTVKKALGL